MARQQCISTTTLWTTILATALMFVRDAYSLNLVGVSPDLATKLISDTKLSCDDNLVNLPLIAVNDDYCDCADGSDEPGTAACSYTSVSFFCKNENHVSKYIPTMQVNDGLCDCCDGSDEYASSAGCKDVCTEEANAHALAKEALLKRYEAGGIKRQELVTLAAQGMEEVKGNIAVQEAEVKKKEQEQEIARLLLVDEEDKEEEEKESKLSELRASAVSDIGIKDLSLEQLQFLVLDLAALAIDHSGVLKLISKRRETENLEPFAPTIAAQEEEHEAEMRARRKRNLEREEKAREKALASEEEKTTEEKATEGQNDSSEEEEDTDEPSPVDKLLESLKVRGYESEGGKAARKFFSEASQKVSSAKTELEKSSTALSGEYGPDNVFWSLRDKCISTKSGQYKYEFCFFGKAKQDAVSLGKWSGFEENGRKIKFSGGQKCWNGPARSFTVTLECGDSEEMFNIDEPETCVYVATVSHPVACETSLVEAARSGQYEHDEL